MSKSIFGLIPILLLFACSEDRPEESIQEYVETESEEVQTLPLFQKLDTSSGFYFINENNENEALNILTYEYLYNGSGVAVGNINGDSLPDIFMGGNQFGGRLFLNEGNLKFNQISETANVFSVGYTTGVSMVDVNGDGLDDIYLCKSLSNDPEQRRNVLLINNGDLTFTNQAAKYGLDDPSFSTQANFFDFDNDGDLDLYLLNHRVDFSSALAMKKERNKGGEEVRYITEKDIYTTDRLFENTGEKFVDITKKAGVENRCFGLSVVAADINQDGWKDLYIANDYMDKDQIMINNKNGTFFNQTDDYLEIMSKNSMGCDIADFNNDGLLDIINLDMIPEGNKRQKLLKGAEGYELYQMASAYGLGHQVMRNTLHLNNGDGTFSEIGQFANVSHTDWSWSPVFADFDNDGKKDLFISNGYYRDVTNMDYMKYESSKIVSEKGGLANVPNMDLVALMKSNPTPNYMYQNKGDLQFENLSRSWGTDDPTTTNGVAVVDLDLDGDLEIITNNFNAESFIYENRSEQVNGNNTIRFIPTKSGCKVTIYTGESFQFAEYNPYKGFLSNHEKAIHFGVGNHTKIDSVFIEWDNKGPRKMENLSANSVYTISPSDGEPTRRSRIQKLSIRLTKLSHHPGYNLKKQYNDFKDQPLLSRKNSNYGPYLVQGDLNNDGLQDVIASSLKGEVMHVYLQSKTGQFTAQEQQVFIEDSIYYDGQPVLFDVDGDNDLDLYVPSGGSCFESGSSNYQDRLYINDGNGRFTKGELPEITQNGRCAIEIDYDKDGDLDLVVFAGDKPQNFPLEDRSFVLNNENGVLKKRTTVLPNSGELGLTTDVERLKDRLIVSREWGSLLVLRFDEKSKQFEEDSMSKSFKDQSGLWLSLSSGDLDKDGTDELIAGNHGTNDFFKTKENSAIKMIAADLNQDGKMEPIEFYKFNDGIYHPRNVLDEFFAHIPALRKQYPRYLNFADATMDSFLGAMPAAVAKMCGASEFRSTVFKTEEQTNIPLPNVAQFSEVFDLEVVDINNDGVNDLVLAGNNSGVNVSQGDMAALGIVVIFGESTIKGHRLTDNYARVKGEYRGVELLPDGRVLVLQANGVLHQLQLN